VPKKETIADLEKQKADIENLLSSLESGLTDGSIPKEHYDEVKKTNTAKLEEIKSKINQAKKEIEENAVAKAKEKPKPEEPKEEPAEKPQEKKEEKPEKKSRVGSLVSRISGQGDEKEAMEQLKEKIIMEISPKVDKLNLRMVKLKAFVDALKEDKEGERESVQRLTEEFGEARSTLGTLEGRMSEMELKVEDAVEALTDIKPQRFAKELQKKDEEIKMHETRLEKIEDMNSTILKRVNQTQVFLEKLGSIENIAEMTKDLSSKMILIDDKEKKITRLADKIDNMFVELNKRLQEFMFY
jgi:chromosome segregation ATPase